MANTIRFRVHLIYSADGMTRPLSFRQVVPAFGALEAVNLAEKFIGSAYVSGFKVLTWSCENLDMPVRVKYVDGKFAEEVTDGTGDHGGDDHGGETSS